MSADLQLWVEGIGLWAPGLPDWNRLCQYLHGKTDVAASPARPPASLLTAAEQRRVPDSVRLAVEVATQAVSMSKRDAATLPSLFSSAHGDPAIMDYLCTTLAAAPLDMSPTRFHNSVHNAAAGYWTIATGCQRASNAVCASTASFGAGLLEAATQAVADHEAVLLVAFDTPGCGPLVEMITTDTSFGCALVLSPEPSPNAWAALSLRLQSGADPHSLPRNSHLRRMAQDNASGDGLTLLEALTRNVASSLRIAATADLVLRIDMDVCA